MALIPVIVDYVESSIKVDKELILSCVDFIRTYADKYHHMKEEDILFKYVDEKAEIILIMYKDHDTGRGHIRQVVEGAEKGNKAQIREHLLGYRDLLTQHIKKRMKFFIRGLTGSYPRPKSVKCSASVMMQTPR